MSNIVSLSEAASIAMHGVILIAQENNPLNVLQIAEKTGSSKHHVAKVFQRLVKEGIVSSQRGPNGGFRLNINPEEVNLLRVYEIIEGKINVKDCPVDHPICPFNACVFNGITQQMTKIFRDFLAEHTISYYLNNNYYKILK